MSLAEILEELPRLTSEQRQQVAERVSELEGDWLDADQLSSEQKRIIEARLSAHHENPESALPWEAVKARLRGRSSLRGSFRRASFKP